MTTPLFWLRSIATLCGISAINTAFAQTTECNLPITSEQTDNKTQLRTFDIKDFNKHNIRGERYITLPNGVVIWQWDGGEDYIEQIKKDGNPYECTYAYNRKGQLISQGKNFYGFNIGISTEYDSKGNIIEQTNWDKDTPFNIDQLVEKMKREFNIDLFNPNQTRDVRRFLNEPQTHKSYYEVLAYIGDDRFRVNSRIIDATTGEILFYLDKFPPDDGMYQTAPTAFSTYLESLNTTQQP